VRVVLPVRDGSRAPHGVRETRSSRRKEKLA
jgi:hypothetical protein